MSLNNQTDHYYPSQYTNNHHHMHNNINNNNNNGGGGGVGSSSGLVNNSAVYTSLNLSASHQVNKSSNSSFIVNVGGQSNGAYPSFDKSSSYNPPSYHASYLTSSSTQSANNIQNQTNSLYIETNTLKSFDTGQQHLQSAGGGATCATKPINNNNNSNKKDLINNNSTSNIESNQIIFSSNSNGMYQHQYGNNSSINSSASSSSSSSSSPTLSQLSPSGSGGSLLLGNDKTFTNLDSLNSNNNNNLVIDNINSNYGSYGNNLGSYDMNSANNINNNGSGNEMNGSVKKVDPLTEYDQELAEAVEHELGLKKQNGPRYCFFSIFFTIMRNV
jgi:hypothetical protein